MSVLTLLGLFFFAPIVSASVTPGVTYQGRILKPDGTTVEGSVQFKLQIRTPSPTDCLLFEETQTISVSNGAFSLTMNDGSVSRTDTTGFTIDKVFANTVPVTLPAATCTGSNVYTPNSSDGRVMKVSFKDSVLTAFEDMPAMNINYVPYAVQAKQVGGFAETNLLRFAESDGTLDATSPLNNVQYTELVALVNGTSTNFTKASSAAGTIIPSYSGAPGTPASGSMWIDSVSHNLKFYDGTATQTLGVSGGSVTSVATGAGLTGGPITSAGTIALSASGVTAGTYPKVTVDTYGRATSGTTLVEADIPPLLTAGKVFGSAITSGAISGSTSINTSGAITTTGTVTAAGVTATAIGTQGARIFESTNTHKVTLQAPAALASGTDYALTLPPALGTNGQTLITDASGNLSWSSPSVGSVTSVTASAPLVSSGGTTPNLTLPAATASVDGYLTQSNWTTFNSKLTSTLASANIFVGNGSNVATAVAASGDVSLTNAGAFTVNAIKGKSVSAVPTTAGQVLRYDGTNWTPNFVSMQDLRSTVTGALSVTNCAAGQTLTYTSGADNLACTTIAVADSQITYASQTANKFFASPNGSAGAPTYRAIASADLPAGGYDTTYFKTGGNTFGAASSIGNTDNFDLTVKTNNLARMTVQAGGNVGIGTATPAQKLTLSSGNLLMNKGYGLQLGNDAFGEIRIDDSPSWLSTVTNTMTFKAYDFGAISGAFVFRGSNTGTNFMTITNNGNVGIGTSSPGATLDVKGHVANSGSAATVGTCGTTPANTGNDTRGVVTLGTGSPTACTVTFASAYATAPYCVITPYGGLPGAIQWYITTNTTTLVMNFSASPTASQQFQYQCMQ